MRKLPALLLGAALGLADTDAHATNRELCSSVPGECEFSGPEAPVLAANVCWFRSTSTTKLMTGATCPTGASPYFVKYGLVDPLSQEVSGFVPLDYVCSRPGLCQPGGFAPPTLWEEPACCYGGVCYPFEGTNGCDGGELLLCLEGVTNEDGTITCFDDWS